MSFTSLENMLASICSVEVGLSEEAEYKALCQHFLNEDVKARIKSDIDNACEDAGFSWINLLDNERYTVFPAETEEEAREYLINKLKDFL